jgi:hypothetical protein
MGLGLVKWTGPDWTGIDLVFILKILFINMDPKNKIK